MPFLISAHCCDAIKKAPLNRYGKETGKVPMIGVLAEESKLRETQYLSRGCNAYSGRYRSSTPMAFWTEQDVLEYIATRGVEICSVYGEVFRERRGHVRGRRGNEIVWKCSGVQRTGCIYCPFGINLERKDIPSRFQRLKLTHPRHYEYCIGGVPGSITQSTARKGKGRTSGTRRRSGARTRRVLDSARCLTW